MLGKCCITELHSQSSLMGWLLKGQQTLKQRTSREDLTILFLIFLYVHIPKILLLNDESYSLPPPPEPHCAFSFHSNLRKLPYKLKLPQCEGTMSFDFLMLLAVP
jgi:hypothetical protein